MSEDRSLLHNADIIAVYTDRDTARGLMQLMSVRILLNVFIIYSYSYLEEIYSMRAPYK